MAKKTTTLDDPVTDEPTEPTPSPKAARKKLNIEVSSIEVVTAPEHALVVKILGDDEDLRDIKTAIASLIAEVKA